SLSVLIIEDNPGDFVLLQDYLLDKLGAIKIHHKKTCAEALAFLASDMPVDVILLDLMLPDVKGETLVKKIHERVGDIPMIILTGYTDIELARRLLSYGVSDFLIKDETNAEVIYKAVIYALERENYIQGINKVKKVYQDMFNLSPQPMLIYNPDTLQILDVNQATISKYGYTHEEFLKMTVKDIRPKDHVKYLEESIKRHQAGDISSYAGVFTHLLKSGETVLVKIYRSNIEFEGKIVRLVLVNDITEKQTYVQTIEAQNNKLKEIAWTQSHVVRAPLSRLLGVIHLLEVEKSTPADLPYLLEQIKQSGNELDEIVQTIVAETSTMDLSNSKTG